MVTFVVSTGEGPRYCKGGDEGLGHLKRWRLTKSRRAVWVACGRGVALVGQSLRPGQRLVFC